MEPVTCENIIVEISKGELNPELLRQKLDLHGSGCVVSFVGITRDVEEGVDVIQLEFDTWEQQLEGVLYTISEEAISKSPVSLIASRVISKILFVTLNTHSLNEAFKLSQGL